MWVARPPPTRETDKSSATAADMPTARGKCNVRAHGAITRYHLDCLPVPAGCSPSSFMASILTSRATSWMRIAHLGMHDWQQEHDNELQSRATQGSPRLRHTARPDVPEATEHRSTCQCPMMTSSHALSAILSKSVPLSILSKLTDQRKKWCFFLNLEPRTVELWFIRAIM